MNFDTWYLDCKRFGQTQNQESLQVYHVHQVLRGRSYFLDNAGKMQPTYTEAAAKIAEKGNKII